MKFKLKLVLFLIFIREFLRVWSYFKWENIIVYNKILYCYNFIWILILDFNECEVDNFGCEYECFNIWGLVMCGCYEGY